VDARIVASLDTFKKDVVEPLQLSLKKAEEKTKTAEEKVRDSTFRRVVGDALVKAGADPTAIDYLVTQARDSFEVREQNGEPIVHAKADKFSAAKPGDPLPVTEWITSHAMKNHAFAFRPNEGGGAGGSGNGSSRREGNTLFNPDARTLGANAEKIAKGEMKVVHTN